LAKIKLFRSRMDSRELGSLYRFIGGKGGGGATISQITAPAKSISVYGFSLNLKRRASAPEISPNGRTAPKTQKNPASPKHATARIGQSHLAFLYQVALNRPFILKPDVSGFRSFLAYHDGLTATRH
jgi:hypothetical protein